MANQIEIKVPDIGGAADVDVIEVMVNVGDTVAKDDSLITLESDKASMEIPASEGGKIAAIKMKVGDKASEGDVILLLEAEASATTEEPAPAKAEPQQAATAESKAEPAAALAAAPTTQQVTVPDIGGANDVDIIEVLVKAGDQISKDDSIITLESDKASMEIPTPYTGVVEKVMVKVGDKVSQDSPILTIKAEGAAATASAPAAASPAATTSATSTAPAAATAVAAAPQVSTAVAEAIPAAGQHIYAGPAVRRMARELGVDLNQVKGTGTKGRISKDDINIYVKQRLAQPSTAGGFTFSSIPEIDFSQFGQIEVKPLSKIKRLTGENVHRSWVTVPHVTQFDEADITDMEAFRKQNKAKAEQQGVKLTPLAFIVKAVTSALIEFPQFNASLDPSAENLIYKKYFNVGIAVDTPAGLVVPVIKDTDKKGIFEIAEAMGIISQKARDKKLMPKDMQGNNFTVSSLGGISGTAFTPIVNTPDVAILGVSRSKLQPVYQDGQFVPRLMLPLSLSYDHRVIDGAEAARFTKYLSEVLSDIRKILL